MRQGRLRSTTLVLFLAVTVPAIAAQAPDASAHWFQATRCSSPGNLEPFAPVLTALERGGLRVERICRSHFEGTFVAPNSAAVVWTDAGGFDLVAFETAEALADFSSEYTTELIEGKPYYTTTVTGLLTRPAPFKTEGTQRPRFLRYGNSLVITFDDRVEQRIGGALVPQSSGS